MVICYDIRFPVWCRNVNNEYDILIAIANWPKVRVDAWNKLCFARAIENESYLLGVDCNGVDKNGYEYDGSSFVIDFKGKDISVRDSNRKVEDIYNQQHHLIYATLDKEKLERFREKFPAWQDADSFQLRKNL